MHNSTQLNEHKQLNIINTINTTS